MWGPGSKKRAKEADDEWWTVLPVLDARLPWLSVGRPAGDPGGWVDRGSTLCGVSRSGDRCRAVPGATRATRGWAWSFVATALGLGLGDAVGAALTGAGTGIVSLVTHRHSGRH